MDSPEMIERTAEDKDAAARLLAEGRYQAAVDRLAPWVERETRDAQVYAMTAKAQWKSGALDEAVSNYERALRIDYSDAYAHMELAQILMETAKIGRAHTEFELAVQFAPGDPLPHYNYGLALHRLGEGEQALAHWRKAQELAPDSGTYAEAVGIGLSGTDDEEALRYFELADSLGADAGSFHNNFGLLLQRRADYARAEAEFRKALTADPGEALYRRNLAVLFMVAGRFAEAVPLLEELHREAPGEGSYRIYLGRAYLESGRPDAAIGLLEEWAAGARPPMPPGRSAEPGPDEAFAVLALSYRARGDLDTAAAYIRRSLEMEPDNVAYLTDYGVILAENGKIAEAKALWNRVLEIDPGNVAAKGNLSVYER